MADGLVSEAQATVVVQVLDDLPDSPGSGAPGAGRDRDGHPVRPVPAQRAPTPGPAPAGGRGTRRSPRPRKPNDSRTKNNEPGRRPASAPGIIGDGLARTTIVHPVPDRDRLLTYLESYTSPSKHPDAISGEEDRIPHHRLLGQAFGALLEHLDPAQLPAHGGDATTLMVTIDLDSLRNDLGTGSILGGEPLSATEVRRLACDSSHHPGRPRRQRRDPRPRPHPPPLLACPAQSPPSSSDTNTAAPKAAPSPPPGAKPTTSNPGLRAGRRTWATASSTAVTIITAPTTHATTPPDSPTATPDSTDEARPTADPPDAPPTAE